MNKTTSIQSEQYTVLLSLAATHKPLNTDCPTEEKLAIFLEGRMNKHDHKAMVAHMGQCSECYYDWLQVFSDIGDRKLHSTEKPARPSSITRWWKEFKLPLPDWPLAAPAFATIALSVMVVLILPSNFNIDSRMDSAFQSFDLASNPGFQHQLRTLPFPWESDALSFDARRYSPPNKAFGSGLIRGKSDLLTKPSVIPTIFADQPGTDWETSKWRDYYTFGRWTLLTLSLAETGQGTPEIWAELRFLQEKLLSIFNQRVVDEQQARFAANTLEAIAPLVPLDNQPTSSQLLLIKRELNMVMQRFFL